MEGGGELLGGGGYAEFVDRQQDGPRGPQPSRDICGPVPTPA
jgi:hypothetical protein